MSRDRRFIVGLVAVVALLTGGILTFRLPLDPDTTLRAFRACVTSNGLVGMVGFGTVYVVLVLVLIPGAAVTLAAGALFGPFAGVLVVAVATSVADAVAFLLARYVAREAIVSLKSRHPRFQVFDRALSEGGWRVVALLRLNPTIPYSASNYLFGVSGVAFFPYLVASGLFTLPGAFAYTYLGHVGAETLGGETRSIVEWGVLTMGLAATIGTVVYVTVLARRALETIKASAR